MSDRVAAFFDVDGTLLEGDIVRYYARLRTLGMGELRRALWMAGFVLRVPYYMALDRRSRRRMQLALYRNYSQLTPAELETRAAAHFEKFMLPRLFPGALQRIQDHLRDQHLVVLITGSLRPIVAPLASRVQASALIAPELRQQDGVFTGELEGEPLTAERKAEALLEFAAAHHLDPASCYAYADSLDDLPFLSRVGHPSVVNPGPRLRSAARRCGWEILHWGHARMA